LSLSLPNATEKDREEENLAPFPLKPTASSPKFPFSFFSLSQMHLSLSFSGTTKEKKREEKASLSLSLSVCEFGGLEEKIEKVKEEKKRIGGEKSFLETWVPFEIPFPLPFPYFHFSQKILTSKHS
jgi:hypothetical protein